MGAVVQQRCLLHVGVQMHALYVLLESRTHGEFHTHEASCPQKALVHVLFAASGAMR
jgi:hypothetical protein